MTIDVSTAFTADELPLAERVLTSRAKRLGMERDAQLRPYLRDLVFGELGRPDALTESAVAAAEAAATAAEEARQATAPTTSTTETATA